MKYTYATLLLSETGAEINEQNLVAVLDATGTDVSTSRVKATIAALEGVDIHAAAGSLPADGTDPEVPEADLEPPEAAGDGDEIPGNDEAAATDGEEDSFTEEEGAVTDGGRRALPEGLNGGTNGSGSDGSDAADADEAREAGQ